ncbi:MAG: hypothetical protein ACO3JL_15030 [Myxococcota bacterium]
MPAFLGGGTGRALLDGEGVWQQTLQRKKPGAQIDECRFRFTLVAGLFGVGHFVRGCA